MRITNVRTEIYLSARMQSEVCVTLASCTYRTYAAPVAVVWTGKATQIPVPSQGEHNAYGLRERALR